MKHTYAVFLCFLFSVFYSVTVKAQDYKNCGSSEKLKELINEYPEILEKQEELEKFTKKFIATNKDKASNQHYIIPVVFHVLHEYGLENISDAQIFDAMRILNEDYSKNNPDLPSVISEFDTIVANCNIEFRLARRDPYGNCTSGIEHIYTHKTNNAQNFSKISFWNRAKYLNVWVVKTLEKSGTSGYAYYPSAVTGANYSIDGIVVLHDYLGSIGTSSIGKSRTLTHEVGHYLNLQHVWGDNNDAGVACGDDAVYDTPNTKGFTSCPSNPSLAKICDSTVVENYQNYMDYSFCTKMFTEGQKERMIAALNSSVSDRNNLWKMSNLIATGTDTLSTTEDCAPIADFYSSKRLICQGDNIALNDASSNATITGNDWVISLGTPSSSTLKNPVISFNNLYWQNISLTAYNSKNESNTITKNNYIFVSPPWADYFGTFSEGFENQSVFNSQWISITNEENNSKWQRTNLSSYTGNSSLYLNAYSVQEVTPNHIFPAIGKYDIDAIISPSFDLSSVTSGKLNFKYSYSTRANSSADITETFKIYTSNNCGKIWTLLYTNQGVNLVTNGLASGPYVPTQGSQWQDVSINIPTYAQQKNVRFKFEYTSSDYSNNFFIDDINISGVVGIDELNVENPEISIYPNPFRDNATISYTLLQDQNINIEILDLVGNTVLKMTNGEQKKGMHNLVINKGELKPGIYLIRLNGENNFTLNRKIIVQ